MLKVPAIDIAEVGAGGGSLAGIDQGGLLVVGPQSAGAMPGPACYGLGNDRPTVTDANVVLGFINPNSLAGGKLQIDRSRSEAAIHNHVGKPLNLPLADAAHGIRAVANAAMARAVRAVTIERGRDPRDLTLMAFGGMAGCMRRIWRVNSGFRASSCRRCPACSVRSACWLPTSSIPDSRPWASASIG